jgi:hypothetical protein
MKNNLLTRVLVGLVAGSAFLAAVFACRCSIALRDLRRVQPKIAEATTYPNIAQSLLNDTLEYSRHNPAIDPLLQTLNVKSNVVSSSGTSKPAAK